MSLFRYCYLLLNGCRNIRGSLSVRVQWPSNNEVRLHQGIIKILATEVVMIMFYGLENKEDRTCNDMMQKKGR